MAEGTGAQVKVAVPVAPATQDGPVTVTTGLDKTLTTTVSKIIPLTLGHSILYVEGLLGTETFD